MATIGNLVVNIMGRHESLEKSSIVSRVAIGAVKTAVAGAALSVAGYSLGITKAASATQAAMRGIASAAGYAVTGFHGLGGAILGATGSLARLASGLITGRVAMSNLLPELRSIGQAFANSAVRGAFMASLLGNIGTIALVAAAALTALGVAALPLSLRAVKLAANFEQLEVSFSTMLGSGQRAKQLLSDISEFAAATPFEFDELGSASRSLVAFGVRQENLISTLTSVGDVAAGISQPLGEIAEIYGKILVQGRLYGDDIRQLQGRGIPIIQELAKQYGVTESAVRKLVENGKVGTAEFQAAWNALTAEGGRFHDMMAKQSKTVAGLFSTLKDNISLAFRDIGRTITETSGLKEGITALIKMTDQARELAAALQQSSKFLTTIASAGTGAKPGDLLGAGLTAAGAGVQPANTFGALRDFVGGLFGFDAKKAAADEGGKLLEQKRLAVVEQDAERRRRQWLPTGRTLNELIKGLFLDSLGPINKEAAREKSRAAKSPLQNADLVRDLFFNSLPAINRKAAEGSFKSHLQTTDFVRSLFLDSLGPAVEGAKREQSRIANGDQFARALEKGSRDEFNTIVRSILQPGGTKQEQLAQEHVQIAQNQLRELRDLVAEARDNETTVVEIV